MTLKNLNKVQLERTISDMAIGELGYVVPHALLVDSKTGEAYVEKDWPVEPEVSGTVKMPISRLSKTDYEVDVYCITHWTFLEARMRRPEKHKLIHVGNIRAYCTEKHLEDLK